MNRHAVRFIALYGAVSMIFLVLGLVEMIDRADPQFSLWLTSTIGPDLEIFIRWHLGDLVYAPFLGSALATVLVAVPAQSAETYEEMRKRAHMLTHASLFVICTLHVGHFMHELQTTPTDPDVAIFAIPLIAAVIFYWLWIRKQKHPDTLGCFFVAKVQGFSCYSI